MSAFIIEVSEIGRGRIIKDGVDISNEVVGVVVSARVGRATRVRVEYAPSTVAAEVTEA